jgi:hypothetical protein
MNLKLKAEYEGKDIVLSFMEKGHKWHYTLNNLKPSQYQRLYDNGYQHLFDVETINTDEMVSLYDTDEEDKGLIDYTSYKKKAVTAKKSK